MTFITTFVYASFLATLRRTNPALYEKWMDKEQRIGLVIMRAFIGLLLVALVASIIAMIVTWNS